MASGICLLIRTHSACAGGDIEDLYLDEKEEDDSPPDPATIIMCPFHNYDWNLKDGSSSTGMKACTFRLEVRDDDQLWLEPPGDPGDDYRVIGVRAVSEREWHIGHLPELEFFGS